MENCTNNGHTVALSSKMEITKELETWLKDSAYGRTLPIICFGVEFDQY